MNITGGKFKGQKIAVPDEKITRPTLSKVRMSVFNTLQSIIEFEGSSFLDLFSGSGVMALEAISRGFTNVTAIEKHPKAAAVIRSNFSKFSPAPNLITGDSLKILPKLNRNFDIIYIDPPYFSGVYETALDAVKNFADIVILEHVIDVEINNFELIKQKKYGDKYISFLKIKREAD